MHVRPRCTEVHFTCTRTRTRTGAEDMPVQRLPTPEEMGVVERLKGLGTPVFKRFQDANIVCKEEDLDK